jgi:hypothetical protein
VTEQQIAPYMAVGLSTVVHGIGRRQDIERNLAIVEDGIHAAVSIIGINMPVRLIALAEGALAGFTDEIFDIPHVTAAFYPVLRTNDIGSIGTICCSDGEYPEAVRALALNGAEVATRRTSGWTTSHASTPTSTRSTVPTSSAWSPAAASPARPGPSPAPATSRPPTNPVRPTGTP